MAVSATRPVAGAAATLLASNAVPGAEGDFRSVHVLIKNLTSTAPVFLGGDNSVTTGNGFQWDVSDGALEVILEPGESLYGIVAATAQTLHVLSAGR
jgi:hypothetical protein